jgi:hypothetical protein
MLQYPPRFTDSQSHPIMPDPNQRGGVNVNGEGETHIGGDVVGRDKHTTTTTTTYNEGGPVARYAVVGLVVVAVLSLIILARLASSNNPPPSPFLQRTASATLTMENPTATLLIAQVTSTQTPEPTFTERPTASPTATEPPPPTQTVSFTPSPPPPTDTSVPTATSTATAEGPVRTATPSPTSSVLVYDDFNDNCLETERWKLLGELNQTATPIPSRNGCLDARRQFFAQDAGRLNVFLDREAATEAEVEHYFAPLTQGCYKQVEVALAMDDMQPLPEAEVVNTYLSVGIDVARVSGSGNLEIRIERGNVHGRLLAQIDSVLTVEGGYTKFSAPSYNLGQVVTIAFRVVGNKLTAYVDNQIVAGPFSILSEPCRLTIGYHADPQTLLDGYFDEVRLNTILFSEINPR